MLHVYVLRCVENKFYVGLSSNARRRISQHMSGEGAAWTKIYPPLPDNPVELRHAENELDEEYTTLKMMLIHGVENVRGGSFANPRLNSAQVRVLRGMLRSARGECFECGKPGHKKRNCPEYVVSVEKFVKKLRREAGLVYQCALKDPSTLPRLRRPPFPTTSSSLPAANLSDSDTEV